MATVVVKVQGGKCGCPFCKDGNSGTNLPRAFWKGRTNKHRRPIGKFKKK